MLTDMSKRSMAAAAVALMDALGHESFAVAGHDRGGLVAQRIALDHPERVSALAVLDIIPVLDMWGFVDAGVAMAGYHLFFLAQPAPLPERLLAGDPGAFVDSFLDGWTALPGAIDEEHRRIYHAAFDPAAVCADYRAGADVDLQHDREDREAGRRISAPTHVLWQAPGGMAPPFNPVDIWRGWADEVSGEGIDCGHFLPEEQPDAVAAALAKHCR
jgi:haloacetate dehalogenase